LEKAVVLFDKSKSELDVTQGKLQVALTKILELSEQIAEDAKLQAK